MTPDEMAEALERTRYEGLRGSVWTDLREGERTARIDVGKRALEQAGVTALLADLTGRAGRADELTGLLAQRDAEIGRRIDEHEAEVADLRTEHQAAVAALEAELDRTRGELAEARALAAVADARATTAETVLAAVRHALTVPADQPEAPPADENDATDGTGQAPESADDDDSAPLITRMVPKSRFGRLAKADRR